MTDQISYRSGPAWHVVYTEQRAECEVVRGLSEVGYDVYLPMERVVVVRRGHKVDMSRPLLPRYAFVAFDPLRDEWGPILNVDGVTDLLSNNGVPSRLPAAWIEAIWRSESCGIFDRTKHDPNGFAIGDHIRITEGPFAGHTAVIQAFIAKLRSSTGGKRAKLLMSFLGQQVSMSLDVTKIEKVSDRMAA
jgi:transcription antitermination factor NusG